MHVYMYGLDMSDQTTQDLQQTSSHQLQQHSQYEWSKHRSPWTDRSNGDIRVRLRNLRQAVETERAHVTQI